MQNEMLFSFETGINNIKIIIYHQKDMIDFKLAENKAV